MLKAIIAELREHAPFTIFGAASGIVMMIFFSKMPFDAARNIFYVFHPLHVLLSALVTASMYELYRRGQLGRNSNLWLLLVIGYVGSIGIATLSDSLIPYWGELLLKMPHSRAHIGFIEKCWLINAMAVLGIAIAYFRPSTKFPHAAHVLLSTWASLLHMIMAMNGAVLGWLSYLVMFIFLFVAVWIPCCVSDIVFPLLFVKDSSRKP